MEGNQMKMRDALEQVRDRLVASVYDGTIAPHEALEIVESALAAPPRNCDVGTAEEQKARFHRFCEDGQHTDKACCGGCPIVVSGMREKVGVSCEIAWAQMPYEEEKGECNGK